MEAVIFTFYLLLISYLLPIIPFVKESGLKRWEILSLFFIKIAAGLAYAAFYKLPRYYEGSDTWRFFRLSIKEKEWLLSDPVSFVKDVFVHGYSESGNLFAGENSYWNDLKSNVPVKLLALMNVVTLDSYYTNIILFNFFFFFGPIAIYQLLKQELHNNKKLLLITGIFLLPSTLFWCSGIHKDGLILSATGLIIFLFNKNIKGGFSIKNCIAIILLLLIVFSLRNYVALALLPALFCFWLSTKYPSITIVIFSGIYLLGIVLFFTLRYITPSLNFPSFIVKKQHEFIQLDGGSEIFVQALQPTFSSFLKYFPTALDMALLQPHPQLSKIAYLPAGIEVILLVILFALVLVVPRKNIGNYPFINFLLFFSISVLLISGYTITLSGAIVRYRSFILPFLISAMLSFLNFKRKRLLE
ncbi:MAG: hypothetical protein JWQ96_233 [Segetibacter sp.]|nr:hypothetical protein [Segetibacter sp.]